MGLGWFRAIMASLTAHEMDAKAGVAMVTFVLLVPFGWLILLLRWAPIRRALGTVPEEA